MRDFEQLQVLDLPFSYAQTCSVQGAITQRYPHLFEFKRNATKGELLYNYLICQVANCVLIGRIDEINPMWVALFTAAPYIAYHMEKSGAFHISKEDFEQKLFEVEERFPVEKRNLGMFGSLQAFIADHGSASLPAKGILVYRQAILVEEAGQYTFRHQYFRDFLAALHIANVIEDFLASESPILPAEVCKDSWSLYVRDMLGDYYGDDRHKAAYNPETSTGLHELLGKLCSLPTDQTCGLTLDNMFETWCKSRKGRIIGEDLTELDLSHLPLNGVVFSDSHNASCFDGSIISDVTFLTQGHFGSVNSVVYCRRS